MPSIQEVRSVSLGALRLAGVPDQHAQVQATLLLEAELRGVPSHGLMRLPRIIERLRSGATSPVSCGVGCWRSTAFWEVDGRQGLGPVVAVQALSEICEKAEETGIAIAAVRNCDHLGMLAWYAEHVATQGKILIALTTSEALVHPWGGCQALLGTNPIAVGIPGNNDPFVFDMATSLVSMGKIHDYASRNEPIPPDWAVDAQGNPTTDPAAAKLGAIAPFGGAKGYGLGLAFELLVTSLAGAAIGPEVKGTLDSTEPCNKGDVFIVIQPHAHKGEVVSRFLETIRQSPATDPGNPVRVPGDRALSSRALHIDEGLPVAAHVWEQIQTLANPSAITGWTT